MGMRERIVSLAQAELGVSEPDGDDRYIRFYNGRSGAGLGLDVPWCACFVTYILRQAGVSGELVPDFCSCTAAVRWHRAHGSWRERGYAPLPGDLIFFDWDRSGDADHVGIVAACAGGVISTVEGNVQDRVTSRRFSTDYACIAGFAAPAYPEEREAGPAVYTVAAGDTLSAVARAHGTSASALQALNGIADPDRIDPGQVLMLAETPEAAVEKLAALGVVDSPAYWLERLNQVPYLGRLLLNAARAAAGAGKAAPDLESALAALEKAGVTDSPAYWRRWAGTLAYLPELLRKLGGSVS